MRVLVIGQNPSKSNTHPGIPFLGTRSGAVLNNWLDQILQPGDQVTTMNLSNNLDFKVTASNLPDLVLRIKEAAGNFDKVLTLGSMASKIAVKAGLLHYGLPHPSGRNRLLNDKSRIESELEYAKEYIRS